MFDGNRLSKSSDLDLIERFKSKHDNDALGELFTRYSALVYGVCLKYLKDRDEAKDAVMQIFEKLNSTLKTHAVDYFKGWLFATSKNHCLMLLRSRKNIQYEEIDNNFMESSLVLHHEEERDEEKDFDKLEKCIQQLKSEQKDCVELFYLKELCYREIVTKTGIDLKKVKSHIQNGKRNLKICMEQSG